MITTMAGDQIRIEIEGSEGMNDFNSIMKVLLLGCIIMHSVFSPDSPFHSDILTRIELQIYKIEPCYRPLVSIDDQIFLWIRQSNESVKCSHSLQTMKLNVRSKEQEAMLNWLLWQSQDAWATDASKVQSINCEEIESFHMNVKLTINKRRRIKMEKEYYFVLYNASN